MKRRTAELRMVSIESVNWVIIIVRPFQSPPYIPFHLRRYFAFSFFLLFCSLFPDEKCAATVRKHFGEKSCVAFAIGRWNVLFCVGCGNWMRHQGRGIIAIRAMHNSYKPTLSIGYFHLLLSRVFLASSVRIDFIQSHAMFIHFDRNELCQSVKIRWRPKPMAWKKNTNQLHRQRRGHGGAENERNWRRQWQHTELMNNN